MPRCPGQSSVPPTGSSLYERAAFTKKPALILWGLKDIAFRKKEMERWKAEMLDFQAHEFKDCGHFLAEEAPDEILPLIRSFVTRT